MAKSKYLDHQGIDIARGLVLGVSCINKFGSTADTITTESTIWDGTATNAIYPYPAASVLSLIGDDTTADDGEKVVVQGLDENYNPIEETIEISATGTKTFLRVFRAFMLNTDNGQDISIIQSGTVAAKILTGAGQTQMAVYTIPAGKMGFLNHIHGSSDRNQGTTACQFKIKAREVDSIFRVKATYGTAGGDQFDYQYPVPLMFDEKTDIRIDATATQGTIVSAIFDIILVDKGPAQA